jgi:hypothetical protein
MSNYEVLSILVSLISAVVALWAIIVSRKTANEQKQMAHRAQLLESRNSVATHHEKYSALLFSVQSQTKQNKEELSEAAYQALYKLCSLFDNFGVIKHDPANYPRYTRHIFHEACALLYQAFKPHVLCQSGMNLCIRFNRLRDIDSNELNGSELEQLKGDAEREATQHEKVDSEDINQELENEVIESYRFRLLVQQLLTRISIQDRPLIMQKALQELNIFFNTYENGIKSLISATKKLEDGLVQNELEEFSLNQESPFLYAAYKEELAKLEILQNLDLTTLRCLADMQIKNSIPELIYIGSVLYTVSMYWNWGHSK